MEKSDRKFFFAVITALLVLLVLVIFALRNKQVVNLDLIFTEVKASQAMLIFISAAMGAIIVGGLMTIKTFATSSSNKKMKKSLDKKDKEIVDLRAKVSVLESENRTLARQKDKALDKGDSLAMGEKERLEIDE